MKKTTKYIIAIFLSLLYLLSLFLPNHENTWELKTNFFNGWQMMEKYPNGSIIFALGLLFCLISLVFFRKLVVPAFCALLSLFVLKTSLELGGIDLLMTFGGKSEYGWGILVGFLLGFLAITAWIVCFQKKVELDEKAVIRWHLPVAVSAIYLLILAILAVKEKFKIIPFLDWVALRNGDIAPFVFWLFLIIFLSVLFVLSVKFFRRWSFALSVMLLLSFLHKYLDDFLSHSAQPISFWLLALLGTVAILLWVIALAKTVKMKEKV
ncbi:hypothetical protein ACFO26_02230 [Lactococcus nasutitermitis]|uniref:DUF998 domain-containing protein n=1 Tax=Lactococcus nasutitermitis TaxID=1652957 RepID=A0ABV9JBN4_9LACT|nr:hypothetical protein [Lactococcus nasutitermitis]